MTAARREECDAPTTGAGDPSALLARCRDAVEPALRAAVARLDADARAQSAYHLGWTDLDGTPTRGGGGKAVRPALALLAARAVGACPDVAVPGAVAVELVHNFSLVHDDLMDGDVERRHRPTVWAHFGSASAVLAGDAMLALAQEVVLEAPEHPVAAGLVLARAVRELVRGQAEDVAFERRDDVTVEDCLAMVEGKTGALLAASTEIGAVLAGGSARHTAALRAFGAELGVAFQLVDDLLGIWGDPAVTGKAVLADLRARKKSLPVTWALRRGGPGPDPWDPGARAELAAWLATSPGGDTEASLRRAAALVEEGGGRAWAAEEARRRLDRALDHLASLSDDDDNAADAADDDGAAAVGTDTALARTELTALGRFLVEREA